MKTLTMLLATVFFCITVSAQTDSTISAQSDTLRPKHNDTMRIGNVIIIKRGGKKSNGKDSSTVVQDYKKTKYSKTSTNWGIVDIGFANYSDHTNYSTATSDGYIVNTGSPLLGKDDFKLRTGKSININIWFFMQQLRLVKQNVGLKYGLGLELNNYRYRSNISYKENGNIPFTNTVTNAPFIYRDSISFSKNKLAADYLTIPVMLNFATNESGNKKGFNIALGVSGGYLYSQRNKQKSDLRGKQKNKGEYDLEKFKFSYIGEIGLGPVKFYASYAPKSIYEHSLDMRPYNFGIRVSN